MRRQNLFTIAPHAPFLKTLVNNICDGTLLGDWDMSGPFSLADVTIILPTRRARLALAEAFAQKLGGGALLPDIRTFGGQPEEEEPFLPPFDAPALPPAISPLKRRLILAQLVEKWVQNSGRSAQDLVNASEILSLADSLAELIDDTLIEQVSSDRLKNIAPENLADNWQATLDFLQIALDVWPQILNERGEIDTAELRNSQLARQSDAAPLIFGDRPVIAAGSTGSIPATANLLKAITQLPRGAIVLPGLDTSLDADGFKALCDARANPHGHPQYGLAQLLARLGAQPDQVDELADNPGNTRTHIMRHAMALANDTASWAENRSELTEQISDATEDISILVARNDEEQARAIALATRNALEHGQTAGIISPDRTLARRIAAELKRFDIDIDDSAGTPLYQSRMGRLARQVLSLVASNCAPVDLIALLRNQQTSLGLSRAQIAPRTDLLEYALLRGQRPTPGIEGLRLALAANLAGKLEHVLQLSQTQGLQIEELLDRLEQALAQFTALFSARTFKVSQFAIALDAAVSAITQSDDKARVQRPDERQFADWLAALKAETGNGPRLSFVGIDTTLQGLMAGISVRPLGAQREDVRIWGQLEARLQNPDLLILAGLSEGIWPEAADPGPWLSRTMRIEAGLEPPERRQGQAAHDFQMALGNQNVLITRAERIGTSPALPSRLLQRIEAFVGKDAVIKMEARGIIWIDQARNIDFAGTPQPAMRPQPTPPVSKRPKSLSVTEVETLMRSPYDLYAKYVLGLRKVDPLGDDPDARERGSLVHAIFSRFIEEGHDPSAINAHDVLMAIAADIFQVLEALPERRILWLERFKPVASGFLEFENARASQVAKYHAELSGRWVFPVGGEDFTLRGRADRIDELKDNTLEIIDFKTGTVPEPGQMSAFTAPQMLLEAAMVRAGAFNGVSAAHASALTYIKIGAGPDAFKQTPFALPKQMDIATATDEIARRLSLQIDAYLLNENLPMSARVFPNPKQRHTGDYDHLARTGEWTLVDGEEEEGE